MAKMDATMHIVICPECLEEALHLLSFMVEAENPESPLFPLQNALRRAWGGESLCCYKRPAEPFCHQHRAEDDEGGDWECEE